MWCHVRPYSICDPPTYLEVRQVVLQQDLGVGNILQHADKDDGHMALLTGDALLRVVVSGNLLVRIVMAIQSLQIKYKVLAAYLCNCVGLREGWECQGDPNYPSQRKKDDVDLKRTEREY